MSVTWHKRRVLMPSNNGRVAETRRLFRGWATGKNILLL